MRNLEVRDICAIGTRGATNGGRAICASQIPEVTVLADDEDAPVGRRFVGTTRRLEAFSDGVFAIAITLLVLDLAIPRSGGALDRVLDAWPFYLAYIVSFLTIGAAWLAHTTITDRLTKADLTLLRLNLLLLLVVAVLPFPTRLVAEGLDDVSSERVFVTMYGIVLLGTPRRLAHRRRRRLRRPWRLDRSMAVPRHGDGARARRSGGRTDHCRRRCREARRRRHLRARDGRRHDGHAGSLPRAARRRHFLANHPPRSAPLARKHGRGSLTEAVRAKA